MSGMAKMPGGDCLGGELSDYPVNLTAVNKNCYMVFLEAYITTLLGARSSVGTQMCTWWMSKKVPCGCVT